jgi:hypothetical protein
MKKKKAIQEYLKEETDKMMGVKSKETLILELYNDPEFIKKRGRRCY